MKFNATERGVENEKDIGMAVETRQFRLAGPENSNEVVYYDSQAMNLIAWLEGQEHIRL